MKLQEKMHGSSVARRVTASILSLSLSACAHMGLDSEPLSEAESCETLKYVMQQADSHFASIKQRMRIHLDRDVWDTRQVFPDSSCEIWEWGKGNVDYVCLWQMEGEADARENYAHVQRVIGECLGPEWRVTEKQTKFGSNALFQKAGEETLVSIRYFKDQSAYRRLWWNALTVGNQLGRHDPIGTFRRNK